MRYEDAVQDVRISRLVDCRYKYAENPRHGSLAQWVRAVGS